jgi:hypothetical protein
MSSPTVLEVADVGEERLRTLLGRFGLQLQVMVDTDSIRGSYWGDSEAGVVGHDVIVRRDTPVHSVLHETCHVICMDSARRSVLERDAGGDDLEEAAVCYLQILLADAIVGVGRDRLMGDMDAWGYTFRLGSTRAWFEQDAQDAVDWLLEHELIDHKGDPTFRMRA